MCWPHLVFFQTSSHLFPKCIFLDAKTLIWKRVGSVAFCENAKNRTICFQDTRISMPRRSCGNVFVESMFSRCMFFDAKTLIWKRVGCVTFPNSLRKRVGCVAFPKSILYASKMTHLETCWLRHVSKFPHICFQDTCFSMLRRSFGNVFSNMYVFR